MNWHQRLCQLVLVCTPVGFFFDEFSYEMAKEEDAQDARRELSIDRRPLGEETPQSVAMVTAGR